ncbi:MAG: PD-(D/E)XK nuclease family protein, partial [Maribacter sp.]
IKTTNITMGQKLETTTLSSFFLNLIEFHEHKTDKGWFYTHLLNILSHSYATILFETESDVLNQLLKKIKTSNWSYITIAQLGTSISTTPALSLLFQDSKNDPNTLIANFLQLIQSFRAVASIKTDSLILEQLYAFYTLLNQLKDICAHHTYINTLKRFKHLFKQLLSTETLDFQGSPVEGIQIMGMLESRLLDFETVIITSVNEGILPSGKSNNSFIPFDLKLKNGLPTYKEKDAVYTYHFYRLLQRAKNVYILYNTEPDALEGGEKSRLITQMLTDTNRTGITTYIASPNIVSYGTQTESIPKTTSLIQLIAEKASHGFSPSSLSNYIRNPMDFYKQNLLNINDVLEVEETLAANTFGTIVHDTLEALYAPFIGTYLSKELLTAAKKRVEPLVYANFEKTYLDGDISTGRNYISVHVILKYITTFIDLEIDALKNHSIKLIGLEESLNISLNVPHIHFPVRLKGKLDRIDEFDGTLRIIDYKTGKVERRNVEIMAWENLTEDYQYSKAFQLLCYAYMLFTSDENTYSSMQGGVVSFKNFAEGTLLFAKKESARGFKNHTIDAQVISEFEQILFSLISEICNPELPLIEKKV